MEHKTVAFELASVDFEGRTFEGHAAVFGNIDQGGDIVHQGAFTKTLAERGGKVKLLWQHNPHEPIGRPLEMREDATGLFVKAIISDTARGRDALALLRDGAIGEMSIGYDALDKDYSQDKTGGEERTVRNLRTIKLWEISLVSFPMNEAARVTALKEQERAANESERKMNLTRRLQAVTSEFERLYGGEANGWRYWIRDVYDDHIVIRDEGDGEYTHYEVNYAVDVDENITFAPRGEWVGGNYTFVAGEKTSLATGEQPDTKTDAAAPAEDAQAAPPQDEPAGDAPAEDGEQAGPDAETPDGADGAPPTSREAEADAETERLLALADIGMNELSLLEVDNNGTSQGPDWEG